MSSEIEFDQQALETRQKIYQEIEKRRETKIIAYIGNINDCPSGFTIHPSHVDIIQPHLDAITLKKVEKNISIHLHEWRRL